MHLEPPLELSRCHLIAELHKWISTITGLSSTENSEHTLQGNYTHYLNVNS